MECSQIFQRYCVLPCEGMSADNILHPPILGSIDEEEVGQALDVVEEDHQEGELAG